MNFKLSWFLALFGLGVIFMIINHINNENISVRQYIVNTYSFILLGFIITSLVWVASDEYQLFDMNNNIGIKLIATTILSFISLYVVMTTSKDSILIKYTAWGVFMVSMGLMTYVTYRVNIKTNMLTSTIIELLAIVAVLSYIAYVEPLDTFTSWGTPLTYILGTLIVIECIDLFFGDYKSSSFLSRSRIYGWIGVIIFSGFILYDTQKILIDAEKITNTCDSKEQLNCADYASSSLGMYMDIINLFNNISLTRQ